MRFDFALKRARLGLLAEMRTEEDVEAIHAAYSALDRTADGAGSGVEADLELHLRYSECHTQPFLRFHGGACAGSDPSMHGTRADLGRTERHSGQVQAEHQAIIDGVVKRSPDKFGAATSRHIENSCRRIFDGG